MFQRFQPRVVVFKVGEWWVSGRIVKVREESGVFVGGVLVGGVGGVLALLGGGRCFRPEAESLKCGQGFSKRCHVRACAHQTVTLPRLDDKIYIFKLYGTSQAEKIFCEN